MAFSIGRAGKTLVLNDPSLWAESGGMATVTTITQTSPATDALRLRDQLRGYQDNWDESIVPVVCDSEPRRTGYYRVTDVQVATDPAAVALGIVTVQVSLEPVMGFSQPFLESILSGARLTNAVGAVDADVIGFHAVPNLAFEYQGPLGSTATATTRVSADGVLTFTYLAGVATLNSTGKFALAPAAFYIGAATFEQGSPLQPVVGRTLTQADVANWRLSNGLVRVTPSTVAGKLDVTHYGGPSLAGEFESVGSTLTLFNSVGTDATGTLNAWTFDVGTPTIAANIVTMHISDVMHAGHPDLTDCTFTARLTWATSAVPYLCAHFADTNNFVYAALDGAVLIVGKRVAGTSTTVASIAAVPVAGTKYWLRIACSGTTYTATVFADSAGALGASIATIAGVITDAAVQRGAVGIRQDNAAVSWGGAFTTVCTVTGPTPSGWTPTVTAGEPAFAWSKVQPFVGVYSASIYNAHSSATGSWTRALTFPVQTSATVGGWVKASAGSAILSVGGLSTPAVTADNTWRSVSATGATTVNPTLAAQLTGTGTAYFDNLIFGAWGTAKTYVLSATTLGTITGWNSLTVLRNSIEETIIRLSVLNNLGVVTIDLGVRRGDNLVRGYISSSFTDVWKVARAATEAATAITYGAVTLGGIRATSNDADGNRYVLLTYQRATPVSDLVNGALTQGATGTVADFAIGSEIGGSAAATADTATSVAKQYLAAQSESQRVVGR